MHPVKLAEYFSGPAPRQGALVGIVLPGGFTTG
jgi:hypothetical protein